MSRRLITGLVLSTLLLISASSARGQDTLVVDRFGGSASAPAGYLAATEADTNKLVADRERFIRTYYEPDPAAMAAIQKSLAEAAKLQDKYRFDVALTLSRMGLALGIASENPEYSPEKRAEVMGRLRAQASRYYAMGPLSLAKVAKMAEGSLSADRIAAGHAKLNAALQHVPNATPVDIAKLDAFLSPPLAATPKPIIPRSAPMDVQALTQQDQNQQIMPANAANQPAPMAQNPAQPTAPTPAEQKVPERPVMPAAAVNPPPQPVQPPAPPREIKPAPATNTWADFAKQCATRFKYTADQQKSADTVLDSVMKRAGSAGDAKDSAGHKMVDVLYDELQQRLESIASIEQRQAAAQAEPKKTGN
ncbi:hypothetical protein RAS2_22420 [Phycisphaerae bacterium RAS2]|nr:hypothetical protein RAS2_22420 [Phycisphaerae bacterium RAS2]